MVRKLSPKVERLVGFEPSSELRAHFESLAMQVRAWAGRRNRVLTLGVVGDAPRVGASTVAFNLASSLAESSFSGQVAVVIAKQPASKGGNEKPGLAEVLTQNSKLEDCLTSGWRENVKLLPLGDLRSEDLQQVPWTKLPDCLQREFTNFDFVVFDLQPITAGKLSPIIASRLDGLLIVCRSKGEESSEVNQLRRFLRDFPVEVLGKVVNRARETGRDLSV